MSDDLTRRDALKGAAVAAVTTALAPLSALLPGAGRYSLPPAPWQPLRLGDLYAPDATYGLVPGGLFHYYNDTEACRARGREIEAWARTRLAKEAPFVKPEAVGELVPFDDPIPIIPEDPVHPRIGALYAFLDAGDEVEHTIFLNLYSPHSPEKELSREIFRALWRTERFSDTDVRLLKAAWPVWSGKERPPRREDRPEATYAAAYAEACARAHPALHGRSLLQAADAAALPGALRAGREELADRDIPFHEILDAGTLEGLRELFGRIADGSVAAVTPSEEDVDVDPGTRRERPFPERPADGARRQRPARPGLTAHADAGKSGDNGLPG